MPCRTAARSVLAICAVCLITGCGSSESSKPDYVSFGPADAVTTEASTPTAEAPTSSSGPGTIASPVSTYSMTWEHSGGYEYSGHVDFGQITQATDAAQCADNPQTDAEIPYYAEVTNHTTGYAGSPRLAITMHDIDNDPITFHNGTCGTGSLPGIFLSSDDGVQPGETIHGSGYVVIRNYYSPDAPDGDPAVLEAIKAQMHPLDGSTESEVTGPGVNSQSAFTLKDAASGS